MELFNDQIDANKYRVFLAVAECKSFSKATEYLHISQPAISHAIKELEDQLNTKLFIIFILIYKGRFLSPFNN